MYLGRTLHSRFSATSIVEHVASELRKKLTREIVSRCRKITVLVDESTTLGKESALIIYIRTVLEERDETIFLGLVELENQKAVTITSAILKTLDGYGLTSEYHKANLLAFACDGASVMLGSLALLHYYNRNILELLYGTASIIVLSLRFVTA
jgi:hypothetical protein